MSYRWFFYDKPLAKGESRRLKGQRRKDPALHVGPAAVHTTRAGRGPVGRLMRKAPK